MKPAPKTKTTTVRDIIVNLTDILYQYEEYLTVIELGALAQYLSISGLLDDAVILILASDSQPTQENEQE